MNSKTYTHADTMQILTVFMIKNEVTEEIAELLEPVARHLGWDAVDKKSITLDDNHDLTVKFYNDSYSDINEHFYTIKLNDLTGEDVIYRLVDELSKQYCLVHEYEPEMV